MGIGLVDPILPALAFRGTGVGGPTGSSGFIGGGLAPFAAGLLAQHSNVHVPFLLIPKGRACADSAT